VPWVAEAQVDTPGKAALVGIAVAYMSLIVIIPFIAVFGQVRVGGPESALLRAATLRW
jgi:hypothetical protein